MRHAWKRYASLLVSTAALYSCAEGANYVPEEAAYCTDGKGSNRFEIVTPTKKQLYYYAREGQEERGHFQGPAYFKDGNKTGLTFHFWKNSGQCGIGNGFGGISYYKYVKKHVPADRYYFPGYTNMLALNRPS